MKFRRWLRAGLVIALVLAVGAVAWSLRSRSRMTDANVVELLADDIARRSTNFEHVEFKLGQTVFRVKSDTFTVDDKGVRSLFGVKVTLFDQLGEATDWIRGEEARYWLDQQRIEFRGDVSVGLADGTQIFSRQLQADLKSEKVTIAETFRFVMGDSSGDGRALSYGIGDRLMSIEQGFRLRIPFGEQRLEAKSKTARYDVDNNQLTLATQAQLGEEGRDQLLADEMVIDLTTSQKVSRIHARRNAALTTGSRRFSGDRLKLEFEPETHQLAAFEMLSGMAGDAVGRRSVFEHTTSAGLHRLEANSIRGRPVPRETGLDLRLQEFEAIGEVRIFSQPWAIREGRSQQLRGVGRPDGRMHRLDLSGDVSMTRVLNQTEEELASDQLVMEFDAAEQLESARAIGAAELTLRNPTRGSQSLRASESILILFSEGLMSEVVARGDGQMESLESGRESRLFSPWISICYDDGVLNRVEARPRVKLEFQEAAVRHVTTSRELGVDYRGGRLERVVQSGNFRLERLDAFVRLGAERAVYSPGSGIMTLTGGHQPWLRQLNSAGEPVSETHADRFEIERKSGEVRAFGHVRTLLRRGQREFAITAFRMDRLPNVGWVEYWGQPRLLQGDSWVAGRRIRFHEKDQVVLVEEDVDSFLTSGPGSKTYRVRSDTLRFEQTARQATYQGNVRAQTEEVRFASAFLLLDFAGEGLEQLSRARAWGGVKVEDALRVSHGETVDYDPTEGLVVVVGQPAQVVDSNQGKAFGQKLIFRLQDEKLQIVGPPGNPQ